MRSLLEVLALSLVIGCGGEPRPRSTEARTRVESEHLVRTETVPTDTTEEAEAAPARPARDLGALPPELAELRWPAPPRISREVDVASEAELESAVQTAGTRARVHGAIGGTITIHVSDVELVLDDTSSIARLMLVAAHRVHVTGGQVGSIELTPPARWDPDATYDLALFSEDVLIDHVRMVASDSALVIRGRRVAVIDSDVMAERYSLWAGDTGPFDGEDLIVAGNTFRSAGPEATLRMHDVLRSVVVDNVLSNTAKHAYRVHGRSDLAFASRNVLVGTGVMMGNQPGDHVGTVIFVGNTLHCEMPSVFELELSGIARLVCRDNVAYTDRVESFYGYARVPDGWDVEHNQRLPFRAYTP